MGASADFSTTNRYIKYGIVVNQNSQSVTNNTSNMTVSVTFWRTNEGYTTYGTGTVYCRINGTLYSASVTPSDKITSAGITLFTKTLDIPHNSDGTKTLTVSAWISHSQFSSNEQSYSQILTMIPRASTITAPTSITIGQGANITLKTASSLFRHKMYYSFGGLSKQTAGLSKSTDIIASLTFTPHASLGDRIPNDTSGVCILTCETYNGSTLIGTTTKNISLVIPSDSKPTISAVALSEATSGLAAKFGEYVQNKSTLAGTITASGKYGATIKSYKTLIDGAYWNGQTFTTTVPLSDSGIVTVTTTVTDSRGFSTSFSQNITVLPYTPPKINSLSAWRIDTSGNDSGEGTRIAMAMNFAISSVSGKNDRTYKFQYRKASDTDFTTFASGTASITYDDTQKFTSAPEISVDYAYVVRLEIADYFQTVVYDVQIPTAFTLMDFRNTGKGMAIGKVSEKDALEVAMNSEFTGQMKIFAPASDQADSGFIRMYRADGSLCAFLATSDGGNGVNLHLYSGGEQTGVVKCTSDGTIVASNMRIGDKLLLDLTHPIGSIYTSTVNTDPGTLFGGTWEQIKDTFLLAAGATYKAGSTGGEATHTLTQNEMPKHNHIIYFPNQSGPDTGAAIGFPEAGSKNTWWAAACMTGQTGDNKAHNNMPPYLTVYVWKRTA